MGLDYRELGSSGTERRIQKLKELHEKAVLGGGLEAGRRCGKMAARSRYARHA